MFCGRRAACLGLAVALTTFFGTNAVVAADAEYARLVKPILKTRCYACHGSLKQEAGLRLDTGELTRRGGNDGAVVSPGDAANSKLLQRVLATADSERMPPEGAPLSKEQTEALRRWIDAGAKSPADEIPELDPREHWSFRAPQKTPVPSVKRDDWTASPIDRFLAAEHERLAVAPAPTAAKNVLLRRVYVDLIGVPPTRDELLDYLADSSPDAFDRVVDRLLASPQHGERWARHWMDIWRYSDWYGRRRENDVRNSYPHIWRWRDWIVRSINADKPYDRMVMEMLAADEVAPEDDEAIAANGFLVRNWYSLNYDQWMRDLVEHTGKAFLGLRLNCALCHDHKYDPISQEEYFRFRAFFEPLELRHDRVPGGPPVAKYMRYKPSSGASLAPLSACLPRVYEEYPDQPTYMYRGGDARDRFEGKPPVAPGVPAILGGVMPAIEAVSLPPTSYYPGLKPWAQQEELARLDAAIAAAEAAVKALSTPPKDPADDKLREENLDDGPERRDDFVMAMANAERESAKAQRVATEARIQADRAKFRFELSANELAKTAAKLERVALVAAQQATVLKARQAFFELSTRAAQMPLDAKTKNALTKAEAEMKASVQKLAEVSQVLEKDDGVYTPLGPTYPTKSTGRRQALAQWMASRDNPLVARVAVNYLWAWHFGRPFVGSVNDFGRSGKAPTHPALLDWLAVELLDSGWSLKHVSRLMVTSRAYQMATHVGHDDLAAKNLEIDRANQSWWRFERQRMESEVLRDSVLHVADQLDRVMGGPEVDNTWANTSRRRSLYFLRHPEEGGVMAFTAQFDAPDPSECYRRTESLVPQQALAMVNSELSLDASRRLARELWQRLKDVVELGERRRKFTLWAFEQVLSREPTAEERKLCFRFWEQQTRLYRDQSSEIKTGPLVAGVMPVATEPELRAAESLVRSLFSHQDFISVP